MAPHLLGTATGVITFFLISGYIIAEVCTFEDPAKFLIKRIFRIYPLYIFAVLAQFSLIDRSIPPWSSLWPRFSLLGDFLGTGHVLNGVDWTLRIEILFYAYMAGLHLFKRAKYFDAWKAPILIVTIIVCHLLPDFPSAHPYFNGFFPILMLGSLILYFEKGEVSMVTVIIGLFLIGVTGLDASTILGVCIFIAAWHYREHLVSTPIVLGISAITYPVYLIHAWYFSYMEKLIQETIDEPLIANISAIVAVAITAWALNKLIERPMIRLGNHFINRPEQ